MEQIKVKQVSSNNGSPVLIVEPLPHFELNINFS